MAFLDKVKEAGVRGISKAKDLGDMGKLNIQKENDKVKMKDIYTSIGQAIADSNPDFLKEFYADEWAKLEDLKADIAKIEEQLAAFKEEK